MSNSKTYRAVEQGFHANKLIEKNTTFTVDLDAYQDTTGEEFKPNWAVEIDDGHADTPANTGTQEALNLIPAAVPVVDRPDQPMPQFHPTFATKTAVEQAQAENVDKSVPITTTADLVAADAAKSAAKPPKSRRRPGADTLNTGTEPSDAEKEEATEASEAEVKADEAADEDADDLV